MQGTTRETKGEKTRTRILLAAAMLLQHRGYFNTRLVDIAEEAGVQTGSIYYHFDSRESLVEAVLQLGLEECSGYVKSCVEELPSTATPGERLRTAIRAHILMQMGMSDFSAAHTRIFGQVPPEIRRSVLVKQVAYGEYWDQLLADAIRSNEIRGDSDRFVLRMLLLGALNWASEWYRPSSGQSPRQVAEQAADLFLHGMLTLPERLAGGVETLTTNTGRT